MDDGTHMPWHTSSSKRIYVASLSWVVYGRVYPVSCLPRIKKADCKVRAQPTPEAELDLLHYKRKTTISVSSPNGMSWI